MQPLDCSPPGSSVHGVLQARILVWVAMPSSRGSSRPMDQIVSPSAAVLQADSLPLSHWVSPMLRTNTFTFQKLPAQYELLILGWVPCGYPSYLGFPGGSDGKESAGNMGNRYDPLVRKIPWRRAWQPTPVFLPGESLGQRSLAGYSPWVTKSPTQLSDCYFILHVS